MDSLTLDFINRNKDKLSGRVMEVGSFNVNGGIRDIIDVSVGIDMRKGKGVDLVCSASDIDKHFKPRSFDAVVSTGTLEHVEDWRGFIKQTWKVVKNGGWLVMTMASVHKGRHAYPNDYWRMTLDQIRQIYPNAEWIGDLTKGKPKFVSIGWVVKKEGKLGSLDFEPIKIK
jgi:predicted SAM-dependent methyltransferase